MRSKRVAVGVVAGVVVAAFAATAWSQQAGFHPRQKHGVKGALLPSELRLWTFDKASGAYKVVPGSAAAPYVPSIRKAGQAWTIAFAEGWAANPFSVPIHKGVYALAKKIG